MLRWLWHFFNNEVAPLKKKSKRDHGDYVAQISRKAAKKIAHLTPVLLDRMELDQEVLVLDHTQMIDIVKKVKPDELSLRIAPNSRFEWTRYFYVRYNAGDESLLVFGVTDSQGSTQVQILKADYGEVLFEYVYGYADDLNAIATALDVADKIQRGVLKLTQKRPLKSWS